MVFENLEFEVATGEYLHLKGSNGSGKSTLLRLLAGLLPAYRGNVCFGDDCIDGAAAARSGIMIYAGHQHGLKPVLTLRENCEAYYQLMTGSALTGDLLETAADGFALGDLIDRPLKYFSSGQKHRCALLRFLLLDRQVWLMDEPTVGLDADNRRRLEAIMAAHLKRGGIIVAASHDPIGLEGKVVNLSDFRATAAHLEHWL